MTPVSARFCRMNRFSVLLPSFPLCVPLTAWAARWGRETGKGLPSQAGGGSRRPAAGGRRRARASGEWTIRAWRTSIGPRANALSSETTGEVGRERAEPRPGRGHLVEPVAGERAVGQGVAPVVEVADDQGRQVGRLAEERVLEQVARPASAARARPGRGASGPGGAAPRASRPPRAAPRAASAA